MEWNQIDKGLDSVASTLGKPIKFKQLNVASYQCYEMLQKENPKKKIR